MTKKQAKLPNMQRVNSFIQSNFNGSSIFGTMEKFVPDFGSQETNGDNLGMFSIFYKIIW